MQRSPCVKAITELESVVNRTLCIILITMRQQIQLQRLRRCIQMMQWLHERYRHLQLQHLSLESIADHMAWTMQTAAPTSVTANSYSFKKRQNLENQFATRWTWKQISSTVIDMLMECKITNMPTWIIRQMQRLKCLSMTMYSAAGSKLQQICHAERQPLLSTTDCETRLLINVQEQRPEYSQMSET